jgi:hypothetical protein
MPCHAQQTCIRAKWNNSYWTMSLAYKSNWSKTCSFPSNLHHAATIHFTRWFSCLNSAFDIALRTRGLNHQFYYELQIHYVSLYIKMKIKYCYFVQNLCLVATTQEYLMVGRPRGNNLITMLRDAEGRVTPNTLVTVSTCFASSFTSSEAAFYCNPAITILKFVEPL